MALGDLLSADLPGGQPGAIRLLAERLSPSVPNLRYVPLHDRDATASTLRYAQLPRLIELGIRPSLVTITLGWAQLLPLDLGDARNIRDSLRRDGDAALQRLRPQMMPSAPLVLATLADPFAGTRPVLAEGVHQFNKTLRELADAHGARIAEVADIFAQATTAYDAFAYLNPEDGSIVPTPRGRDAIAAALFVASQSALTEDMPLILERTSGLPR